MFISLLLSLQSILLQAPPVEWAVFMPQPDSGWTGDSETQLKDGVPVRAGSIALEEGHSLRWDLPHVTSQYAYFFTGLNAPDIPNPGWGGGNSYENFFIGDSAGDLVLTYASGHEDIFPLIFGYTLWWRSSYGFASAPFSTDVNARALLDRALCVANGAEAWKQPERPFFLRVALRDEPLTGIELRDNQKKLGHAVLQGLTFGGNAVWEGAGVEAAAGAPVSGELATWLSSHTLDGEKPLPEKRQKAIHELRDLLYTLPADITDKVVSETKPDYAQSAFHGPRITFTGPPEATILTRTYYDSALEMLARIDPDGMIHESSQDAGNYSAFGTWHPALAPFYGSAYTRNRTMALAAILGFQEQSERVLDFFDRWIMYFPEHYPEIQLGGKPVPGHATVIANKPHIYFDELRHAGWPTRFTTRDFGNPENDGHGFNMLGHWRAWIKTGRASQWVRDRWPAIHEAAEYIPWCLANPALSLSEHGLLYSESEGGMSKVTLYCNVPCYYGLLAYADMAETIEKTDSVARWRETAAAMADAMNQWLATKDGSMWDPATAGDWHYSQGGLSPILFGGSYYGWRAAEKLPERWQALTLHSYEDALTRMHAPGCAPRAFGYGQGYYTQAALLLDRMTEAGLMVNWMARFCFAPGLPHPYRAPEGTTMAGDGSVWRRWGDLGNLYQMNEATYTVQIMVGVDDTDQARLYLGPRVPVIWKAMRVKDYPARVLSQGKSRVVKLGLELEHKPKRHHLKFTITADAPVDAVEVRLGPLPADAGNVTVFRNSNNVPATVRISGDSAWAHVQMDGWNGRPVVLKAAWEHSGS